MKKVSVIMTYYNEERFIEASIASLREQTFVPYEIIAVDDSSTDNSHAIVAAHKDIRHITQPHQGCGAARNTGVHAARGDIVVFVDADMLYDPHYLELLVKPIIEERAVGTTHIDERVANPDALWSQCWSINADLPPGQRTPPGLTGELNIFRAIRKQPFLKAGGFDPAQGYLDDTSLYRKLGAKGLIVPGAIAYHYNPDTLHDVFLSARWVGRSPLFQRTFANALRYSVVNSLRNGLRKVIRGAPSAYIVFKIVYDWGMVCGIFLSSEHETAK